MSQTQTSRDSGLPGAGGAVSDPESLETGGPLAAGRGGRIEVQLATGERVVVPAETLVRAEDGTYLLPVRLEPHRRGEASAGGVARDALAEAENPGGFPIVVAVAREELVVEKRREERARVVVHVVPRERTESVDVPRVEERVEVERVPVNKVVSEAAAIREEGDVTIVPVYEETYVLEKRLVLKEEVRLTRRRVSTSERQEVTLRSEEAEVRRSDGADALKKDGKRLS